MIRLGQRQGLNNVKTASWDQLFAAELGRSAAVILARFELKVFGQDSLRQDEDHDQ